ncbi:MAG: UbiA family prenyltransferase [Chitinophagales bacterium]|nr:UbiA family prenyltransferase [Chitinophagales bacterium]
MMLKIIRLSHWWSIIPPQIAGWIYYAALRNEQSFLEHEARNVLLFIAGVIFIAAFGYLYNDYCDADSDRLACKKNLLSEKSKVIQLVAVLMPLAAGVSSWYFVQTNWIAKALYALQIVALVVYSARPFRLKNRGAWGVICDTFYGHVNPAFFTVFTFYNPFQLMQKTEALFLLFLLIVTSLKGVRNILLHQLQDRKADRMAGIQTMVVKQGALFTLNLINTLLLYEITFTALLVIAISTILPPVLISLLLFTMFTYLKFSGWKLGYLPRRQLKFKFHYFLNDYYERWLPFFLLLILISQQPVFLYLLVLHIIAFPAMITETMKDLSVIRENFKTEEDY